MPVPPQIPVLNASGTPVNVNAPLAPGRAAAAESRPVALSTEDAAFLDSLEALLTSIDGKLTTIDGRVDGLETLIGTTNTTLTTIDGRVDGVEGLIGTTNSTLTTIDGRVDGLEGVLGTPTDAAVANGAAGTIDGHLRQIKDQMTDANPSSVRLATDLVANGTATLTPKFAKITASASGNTSVVALVASKKIRVLQMVFTGNGAVNVKFQSNTTDITGLTYIGAAGGGIAPPFSPLGLFETAAGEALNINLSGAVAVGGTLVYVEV